VIYVCIYNITVLIYSCVLTEYKTLYKFVTTQWDGLCQILTFSFHHNQISGYNTMYVHTLEIYTGLYIIIMLLFLVN